MEQIHFLERPRADHEKVREWTHIADRYQENKDLPGLGAKKKSGECAHTIEEGHPLQRAVLMVGLYHRVEITMRAAEAPRTKAPSRRSPFRWTRVLLPPAETWGFHLRTRPRQLRECHSAGAQGFWAGVGCAIAMTYKQIWNGIAAIAAFVLVIGALIEAWTIVK